MSQTSSLSSSSARARVLGWGAAVLLLLLLYGPTWVHHIRRTWDPFVFSDDARILIWPFFRFGDAALFPRDWMADYYLAGLPEGYRLLYTLAGTLRLAVPLSESLPYLSVLAVVVLLADVARRLGGALAGFLAALLVLSSDVFLQRAGGGLPRCFAFPLIATGLHAAVRGRPYGLALSAVLAMAFYPVAAALLGSLLLGLLSVPARCSPMQQGTASVRAWLPPCTTLRRKSALLLTTLLCSVLLALPIQSRLSSYGNPITPAMLPMYPEAGEGGRLDAEQRPPFLPYHRLATDQGYRTLIGAGAPVLRWPGELVHRTVSSAAATCGFLLLVSVALFVFRQRRNPAALPVGILLLGSILGYTAATWVAPRLFIPERYVQYTIPLVVIVVVSVGMAGIARRRPDEVPADPVGTAVEPTPRGLVASLVARRKWVGASVATVLTVALVGTRAISWAGAEVAVRGDERALHAYLQTLPKDVLIAGWPVGPLENVPYLARRSVLSNHQLQMPFHTRFTLEVRGRVTALLRAMLSPDPDALCRLQTEYGVTHLVFDRVDDPAHRVGYYRPFNVEIDRLRAALSARAPWLANLVNTSAQVTNLGRYAVVELGRVLPCTH